MRPVQIFHDQGRFRDRHPERFVAKHRELAHRPEPFERGFLVGIAGTILFTWAITAVGLVDESMLIAERPLTSFIWQPDALSWIVGFLAGVAGVLALTSAKSGALVGVLISVTTVPAAANAAVALAYWVPSEAIGSGVQLMINLASITVAGVLTLLVQRARQDRLLAR